MVRSGLFAVGVLSAVALCARAAEAEIRIGVAGPMTGAYAWFGEQYERGTELATADLNANGGILGQKLELIVADDFCDSEQGVAVARKLGYEPLGTTLNAYAAVQVWAQAVEVAGSLDLDAVIDALHSRQFDTVLGRIGFDEKGDVTGFEPWQWYVWQADGNYVPLEKSVAK